MKKYKNLIFFLLITLMRSVFLGMTKMFLRSTLKEDHRTLEQITAYISIGITVSYLIGGALAYSFRKKPIAIFSGLAVIACVIIGFFTDYFPLENFVILLIVMGFSYGLWLTVKGIMTTTEILQSPLEDTTINGLINAIMIIGLILGSYRGFDIYKHVQEIGFVVIIGLIGIASIFVCFTNYDQDFKKHTIKSAITKNIPNIIGAITRYFRLLIPISILRAVTTAFGQKMLEIGIDIMRKTPTKGIIIIILSLIGIIIGHIISTFIHKERAKKATIITLVFAVCTIAFPALLRANDTFTFMTIYATYLGILVGIVINFLEGKFYHLIGEDHRKEFGSAAYGIVTSLGIVVVMLIGNTISKHRGSMASFTFFGIIILACIPLIRRYEDHT